MQTLTGSVVGPAAAGLLPPEPPEAPTLSPRWLALGLVAIAAIASGITIALLT